MPESDAPLNPRRTHFVTRPTTRYFCRCQICKIQKVANFDDAPTTRAITKRYNIRQRGRKYYSRSNAILNAQRGFVAALHAVAKVRCQIFRPFIRTNTVDFDQYDSQLQLNDLERSDWSSLVTFAILTTDPLSSRRSWYGVRYPFNMVYLLITFRFVLITCSLAMKTKFNTFLLLGVMRYNINAPNFPIKCLFNKICF